MISKKELLVMVERHGIPGLGITTVDRKRADRIETAGVRKHGTENPIGRDDLFHIGSCTKFMTTCLAQIAVDENRLSWSDNLGSLAGELAIPIHDSLRTITLDQLVTCTSGFPEDREEAVWPISLDTLRADNNNPQSGRIRLARARLSNADDVVQDEQFRYSNIGYGLVGLFLELAYDTVFEELLQQKLFSPLGLETAAFGPPAWMDRHNQPWGHRSGRPVISPSVAENPLALSTNTRDQCGQNACQELLDLILDNLAPTE